jgi:hypothetical protein
LDWTELDQTPADFVFHVGSGLDACFHDGLGVLGASLLFGFRFENGLADRGFLSFFLCCSATDREFDSMKAKAS